MRVAPILAACLGGFAVASIAVDTSPATKQGAAIPQHGSSAHDPGPRTGPPGAGGPFSALKPEELTAFLAGQTDFADVEATGDGLGPTMNLDSCKGCHLQPAAGGSSPAVNPQVAFANKLGATNVVPSFITANGPVREARFVTNADGSPDGGVHSLYTITGRSDAAGCSVQQPNFAAALQQHNVIFRIPTPVFGTGLIEQIPDSAILANMGANADSKSRLGIRGRANIVPAFHTISGQANKNGNDGTVSRFGWKAQNKSLLVFAGEAYNVEMGVSNEVFPTEREEAPACQFATLPNSVTNLLGTTPADVMSSVEKFAFFMRLLAPPVPSTTTPGGSQSIANGRTKFASVGCSLCHTPTLQTGNSTIAVLRNQPANLYSDLLLHDMGTGLADGITQGQAGPSDFRTAPLWGLGQRLFFLHDGRTSDLMAAIEAHQSDGSEAYEVVSNFNRLWDSDKQDLLNFLRSL
jgi:CxxC motif-containing protein (DUF1111 family)